MSVISEKQRIIIAGLIIGAIASLLVLAGNPKIWVFVLLVSFVIL